MRTPGMSWQSSPITTSRPMYTAAWRSTRSPMHAPASTTHKGPIDALAAMRAPAATTAVGCTPATTGGRDAASMRAHSRDSAADGWSTTRKSWFTPGSPA